MWGRKDLRAVLAVLGVVAVIVVAYGLVWGEQTRPGAGGLDASGVGLDAPVTDEERRAAIERLREICRDLEVHQAYNRTLEARPDPGATPTSGLCAQETLSDVDIRRLRYAPMPSPAKPRFANEHQLAHWKRDTLCRRPEFRAATSGTATSEPRPKPDPLRGICTMPTLGADQLRALRLLYVQDPGTAERARIQQERERANLAGTTRTP